EQVEHGRAKTIDVGTRLDLAGEKLRRRVAHRADRGHAFLRGGDVARDAEINQHDAVGSRVNHQVGGLQVSVNDRLRLLRMDVIKHRSEERRVGKEGRARGVPYE